MQGTLTVTRPSLLPRQAPLDPCQPPNVLHPYTHTEIAAICRSRASHGVQLAAGATSRLSPPSGHRRGRPRRGAQKCRGRRHSSTRACESAWRDLSGCEPVLRRTQKSPLRQPARRRYHMAIRGCQNDDVGVRISEIERASWRSGSGVRRRDAPCISR